MLCGKMAEIEQGQEKVKGKRFIFLYVLTAAAAFSRNLAHRDIKKHPPFFIEKERIYTKTNRLRCVQNQTGYFRDE